MVFCKDSITVLLLLSFLYELVVVVVTVTVTVTVTAASCSSIMAWHHFPGRLSLSLSNSQKTTKSLVTSTIKEGSWLNRVNYYIQYIYNYYY